MPQTEADAPPLSRLLGAVADALDIDPPDGSASFQDLGGDSLSAIVIVETLGDEGLHVDIEELSSTMPLRQVTVLHQA
ncbi:hypothetical protein GCM10023170_030790 [Phytohabitans houttuyneae]|uniref:acyl carrier protein n=1 Tax=Phytohabitans houttuyneae TaxID=1076126 RepID=UPI0031F14A2E